MSDKTKSAIELIRTLDVHNAAIDMAQRLKLNAQVRVIVGTWDDRGSITGWTKVARMAEPADTLVEVFVSDLAGEDREFDRYAKQMQRLIDENDALRAENAVLKGASNHAD